MGIPLVGLGCRKNANHTFFELNHHQNPALYKASSCSIVTTAKGFEAYCMIQLPHDHKQEGKHDHEKTTPQEV